MTDRKFDLGSISTSFRDAFAPILRAQQEGLKTVERLARYQFAVAGDYLDWGIAQAKVGTSANTAAEAVGQQTELNSELGDKLRAHTREFGQIATESQGAVSQWFDQSSAEVVEKVKKAA
jgi:phasin family protein